MSESKRPTVKEAKAILDDAVDATFRFSGARLQEYYDARDALITAAKDEADADCIRIAETVRDHDVAAAIRACIAARRKA